MHMGMFYYYNNFLCMLTEGYIHGLLGGDDGHLLSIFHRIIEIEEMDKETMHLLTFLFMQFLSRYNRGVSSCRVQIGFF